MIVALNENSFGWQSAIHAKTHLEQGPKRFARFVNGKDDQPAVKLSTIRKAMRQMSHGEQS